MDSALSPLTSEVVVVMVKMRQMAEEVFNGEMDDIARVIGESILFVTGNFYTDTGDIIMV